MAVVVFSLLFVFFVDSWETSVTSAQKAMKKNRMEFAAVSATDLLIKSAGSSNSSNISMAGFATVPYKLSSAKIAQFTALNYSAQKSLLGMQEQFTFYIEDTNGVRLYEGGNLTVYSKVIVSITRYAVLDGNIVKLRVNVYG
ncbi:MAG: hypothetical protein WCL13_04135 [bacterium]